MTMPGSGQDVTIKGANQRGAARLAAVQALYQMDVGGGGLQSVVAEFEAHRLGSEIEGDAMRPADAGFFRQVVGGVVEQQKVIDPAIHTALPDTWPLSRIDLTLRAILRCGVFELQQKPDIPARVIINEYLDISRAFFEDEEPGLVNAVLDSIARSARPNDFPAKPAN